MALYPAWFTAFKRLPPGRDFGSFSSPSVAKDPFENSTPHTAFPQNLLLHISSELLRQVFLSDLSPAERKVCPSLEFKACQAGSANDVTAEYGVCECSHNVSRHSGFALMFVSSPHDISSHRGDSGSKNCPSLLQVYHL